MITEGSIKRKVYLKDYYRVYYRKNREKLLRQKKEWYRKVRETRLGYFKKYQQDKKLKVLQKISGLEKPLCSNCNCDDIRLLETNHISGGGTKERLTGLRLYDAVLNGKRKTSDLNVLCKVCNQLHYVQMKYGFVPIKVIWEGRGANNFKTTTA